MEYTPARAWLWQYKVGSIIVMEGKRFIVTRKGSTAMVIHRFYWFDRLAAKLVGLFAGTNL